MLRVPQSKIFQVSLKLSLFAFIFFFFKPFFGSLTWHTKSHQFFFFIFCGCIRGLNAILINDFNTHRQAKGIGNSLKLKDYFLLECHTTKVDKNTQKFLKTSNWWVRNWCVFDEFTVVPELCQSCLITFNRANLAPLLSCIWWFQLQLSNCWLQDAKGQVHFLPQPAQLIAYLMNEMTQISPAATHPSLFLASQVHELSLCEIIAF